MTFMNVLCAEHGVIFGRNATACKAACHADAAIAFAAHTLGQLTHRFQEIVFVVRFFAASHICIPHGHPTPHAARVTVVAKAAPVRMGDRITFRKAPNQSYAAEIHPQRGHPRTTGVVDAAVIALLRVPANAVESDALWMKLCHNSAQFVRSRHETCLGGDGDVSVTISGDE